MPSENTLGPHVQSFFNEYLIAHRGMSRHTIRSYRDTLKMLFSFAAEQQAKPVTALAIEDLAVDTIFAFLDYLEHTRGNSVATRNARLAAVHVFFRHVAARDPECLDLCQRVVHVPFKRAKVPSVTYLERAELDAILAQIDRTTAQGRRDYALLSFLYNTGARVQEALDTRANDMQLSPPPHVRLWGKGRKERLSPLWPQTACLLRELLEERGVDPRSPSPVFVNLRGLPLTRFGVRYILAKYTRAAAEHVPTLANKRVHPHTLRHTTAVHMLHSGVDVGRIADQLGHSSIVTTGRYTQVSLEVKREALQACALTGTGGTERTPAWTQHPDLLRWLQEL